MCTNSSYSNKHGVMDTYTNSRFMCKTYFVVLETDTSSTLILLQDVHNFNVIFFMLDTFVQVVKHDTDN